MGMLCMRGTLGIGLAIVGGAACLGGLVLAFVCTRAAPVLWEGWQCVEYGYSGFGMMIGGLGGLVFLVGFILWARGSRRQPSRF